MKTIRPAERAIARTAFELPFTRYQPLRQRVGAARPIVAFVDASREAANAAWRGALVARDRGLPLHLVAFQRLHANLSEAAAPVDALAAELRGQLDVQVFAHGIVGTREHEGIEAARAASLLVLPSRPVRPWRLGSQELRILRRSNRPVLVVRRPAHASYRRVLAAVELDLQASSLIAAAHALSRDPRMKVLHVLDTSHEEIMRLADVPGRAIRAQREHDALRARAILADRIASVGAHEGGVEPVIAFGAVEHRIMEHQHAADADLLVLGKRPRHPLVDALRGGVARSVLRAQGADVLLLPMPPREPKASWEWPDFARGRGTMSHREA